eukprot:scaffold202_cov180-Amphora_coffeaeformis.AAC.3
MNGQAGENVFSPSSWRICIIYERGKLLRGSKFWFGGRKNGKRRASWSHVWDVKSGLTVYGNTTTKLPELERDYVHCITVPAQLLGPYIRDVEDGGHFASSMAGVLSDDIEDGRAANSTPGQKCKA